MKFCIDIDDTILYSEVDENGEYKLISDDDERTWKMANKINDLHLNNEIILWTGRHWKHLELTKKQLQHYGVNYDTLIMGKPPVDYYVDDKAIRPDEFMELEI